MNHINSHFLFFRGAIIHAPNNLGSIIAVKRKLYIAFNNGSIIYKMDQEKIGEPWTLSLKSSFTSFKFITTKHHPNSPTIHSPTIPPNLVVIADARYSSFCSFNGNTTPTAPSTLLAATTKSTLLEATTKLTCIRKHPTTKSNLCLLFWNTNKSW